MSTDDELDELLTREVRKTPLLDAIQAALQSHWWSFLSTPKALFVYPPDHDVLDAEAGGKHVTAIVSLTSGENVRIVDDPMCPPGNIYFSDEDGDVPVRRPIEDDNAEW